MISLVGFLYKLVAKVLAARLGLVMDKHISPNQPTTFKGIMLYDGVVIVNKLVNLAKISKKVCLLLRWIFRNHMT